LFSRNTILYAISWLWLFIFLVLLSSKAGLISLAIPAIYMLYVINQKTRSWWSMIAFSAFFALIFTASFYLFPISFGRFAVVAKTIKTVTPDKGNVSESTFQRIMLWKSAMRILREHPLCGVGTGDVKQAFLKDYTLTGNTTGQEANLNAHNQYLQTSVALGLTGLLILVLTFLFPFILALRKGAWMYGAFLLLVAFNLLFESMLERQAGVMFYAFFNMVLFTALKGEMVNHPIRSKPL
jgi:O-antigen ligase